MLWALLLCPAGCAREAPSLAPPLTTAPAAPSAVVAPPPLTSSAPPLTSSAPPAAAERRFRVEMILRPRPRPKAAPGPRVGNGPLRADEVIERFAPGLTRCVNAAALRDPARVEETAPASPHVLRVQIGENGEVLSVTRVATGTLPDDAVECLLARVRSAQFMPEDGRTTIEVRFAVKASAR